MNVGNADWITNRIRSHRPRSGIHWCIFCDRVKIPVGNKCPLCGGNRRRYAKAVRRNYIHPETEP